jgi:hypothetical protein
LPKNSAKKLAFLTQNKAELCKILIITLFFLEKRQFFAEHCQKSPKIVKNRRKLSKNRRKLSKIAENCQKSPKIVIITSTPGHTEPSLFECFVFAAARKPTSFRGWTG